MSCSLKFKWGGTPRPHLATRVATVAADGYVVLILLLHLQTRRHLTTATKRQIWHG